MVDVDVCAGRGWGGKEVMAGEKDEKGWAEDGYLERQLV